MYVQYKYYYEHIKKWYKHIRVRFYYWHSESNEKNIFTQCSIELCTEIRDEVIIVYSQYKLVHNNFLLSVNKP